MQFRTNKCNHGEKARCINCLTQQLKNQKKQAKITGKPQTSKCLHPPNMKCLKCMNPVNPIKKQQLKCTHPSYQHCSYCLQNRKQYYQSFEQYIQKIEYDCKHKKPCRKCVPFLNRKTFMVDKQCRNHLPYPQAQCDVCMPPTVSIKKQVYSHVKKVIVRTTCLHEVLETNLFGVLLGSIHGDTVFVDDIYFPRQQSKVSHFISPQILSENQQIFTMLGYTQVGLIYASSILTSMDLMLSSVFQEYFCTVNQNGFQISQFITMRLNNDDINPYFECFMVSDQFQALNRHNLIFQTKSVSVSFDLITAKSQKDRKDTPSLPSFLRDGVQTEQILFEQIIMWIQTQFQQNFFIRNRNTQYPFFTIQKQSINDLKMFIAVQVMDPIDKYRNVQFLLHLARLFGKQYVIIFLTSFIYEDPEDFLKEKIRIHQQNQSNQSSQNKDFSLDGSYMIDESFYN